MISSFPFKPCVILCLANLSELVFRMLIFLAGTIFLLEGLGEYNFHCSLVELITQTIAKRPPPKKNKTKTKHPPKVFFIALFE